MNHKQQGFTLVEIAIVLVIVGLMIGGLITPLSMQLEQRKVAETQKALDEAKEALLGFALQYGYLPCPAVSAGNGQEDRSGDNCRNGRRQGFLPWATLGLAKLDSWNHLYFYSVTPAFSDSVHHFTLLTARDITVFTRDSGGKLASATADNDIPALVLSYGKNGYGARNEQGGAVPNASNSNRDEKVNMAASQIFISRLASDNPAAPGGDYDDMLAWVSPNILYNRMVAAQKLP